MVCLGFSSQQKQQEMFVFSTTIETSSGTHPTSFILFPGVNSPTLKPSWCEDAQNGLQLMPWLQVSVAKPLLPHHEQQQLLNITYNFHIFSQLTEPSNTTINM
jgi:hypothetical protein